MDGDKENSKGGCPAKLSSDDKWSITHQIATEDLILLWMPPISSTASFVARGGVVREGGKQVE